MGMYRCHADKNAVLSTSTIPVLGSYALSACILLFPRTRAFLY